MNWRPIETAPKGDDFVLLGWLPDEENHVPRVREGYWSVVNGRWASSLDPSDNNMPQPTHWMPMPNPPKEFDIARLVRGHKLAGFDRMGGENP